MKLKFKKQYAGVYKANSEYRGFQIDVTLTKFEEGGFSYSIYINGAYSFGDGWIGLRKSDILKDIDQDSKNEVDEKIRQKQQH